MLDQVIETFDPELDTVPASPIPEPKAGTELLRYRARDGAHVSYQYDPAAQNGKQYVVAIHREPANWSNLREEDLSVTNEEELRREMEERLGGNKGLERRDSAMELDVEE